MDENVKGSTGLLGMKWACVPEGGVSQRCGHRHACVANETTGSLVRCDALGSRDQVPKCHYEHTSLPAVPLLNATKDKRQMLALASPTPNSQLCEDVSSYLPSFCQCDDEDLGFKASCSVNFLEVDTITVLAEVVPCQAPAHADLTISDSELGISHQFAGISAGEAYNLPVPGLSLDVPLVGEVGVVMDIELDGDLSSFEIDLAVDACAGSGSDQECGSDLTSYLPIELLSHSFNFDDVC